MDKKFILITFLFSILGFTIGFFIIQIYASDPRILSASDSISQTQIVEQPLPEIIDTPTATEDITGMEDAPELLPSKEEIVLPKEKDTIKEKNNCPVPEKIYDDYSYLDVGQIISIPDTTYTPPDLVELAKDITKYPTTCLRKEAADALVTMITDAKKDGYSIKVSSAFRSYDTQKFLLDRSIKNGNKEATRRIAKPGHSEHQLGLAVDLTSPSIHNDSSTTKFEGTKEYAWLQKNAHLYGFEESYPKDKEHVTGYMHESWHYRYVGPTYAAEISESGQTINEYLKAKKDAEDQQKSTL